MWMIADENTLCHYGVKGMKWKNRKAGMPSNYSKAVVRDPYSPYGPQDKLNRTTHGSAAGVPSNLYVASRFSNVRTKNSRYAGEGQYRTSAIIPSYATSTGQGSMPVRRLNTGLTRQGTAAAIRKKLRSNSRYKASRAGMPSYVRR